jgi:hypothetical protein
VIGDFGNRQQSSPEQLNIGLAEHHRFQGFERADLAFSLAVIQRSITEIADDPV